MCCRYYFADGAKKFIKHLAVNVCDGDNQFNINVCDGDNQFNINVYDGGIPFNIEDSFASKDIHPNDLSWILIGREEKLYADQMGFGFRTGKNNQLLINARSETVFEKPTFSSSIESRRCIIACDKFYEWDRNRQIATLGVPDQKVILLAGIYDLTGNEMRFTVLTREANESMKKVHDRMPLILGEDQVDDWIHDSSRTREILLTVPPALSVEREYEQLSLFN